MSSGIFNETRCWFPLSTAFMNVKGFNELECTFLYINDHGIAFPSTVSVLFSFILAYTFLLNTSGKLELPQHDERIEF